MTSRGARWLTCFALVAGACRPHGRTAPSARPVLQPSIGAPVAQVGGDAITADDLRAVARVEGLTDPRAALERAITLRLMAREAARRGLDRDPIVADLARRAAVQSLLAHTVEQQVRPDTLPPQDMQTGMRIRGFELAHGELWRTFHVLVRVPPTATPEERAAMRTRAEAAHAALTALPSPRTVDQFRAAATAALPGITPRFEDLPPIDAQGRYANGDMVEPFARAATALERPGDVSDVVETPFGYHVILLVERQAPRVRPEAEVRAIVSADLLSRLRHAALEAMIARLRTEYHATVRDEALERVDHVPIEPPARSAPGGGS